ncbi:tRNA pseudouridine(38-40) synthase TruA [uncultured Desulfuromusa sp.]|uniref:tRNA pseudouridine(38-40) synthase TruA n=1 Tax=uncultured Desulfuromusa sp. TaxID=219183 RepID=UPI002AA854EC|nr:tRNA pseudouridine(38-40) synthase TruA [uncultured Desulfuromusa sp.]
MVRIKLIVAYDGTNYVGWQYQPNGISVQQRLEQALRDLTGIAHTVYSSGRTDSGVHARGMVCHLDTEKTLPETAWREGLNRFLPDDIAVRHAEQVDQQFHARFSARGKRYRYTILRDSVRSPLDRTDSWQVKKPLDVEKMQQAALSFIGRHDFAAFRTSGCSAGTTIREIFSITFSGEDSLLHIDVCGSGFLRNMIRMMVGTLVQIGRGKRPVDAIQSLLADPGSAPSPLTAPAKGLCLMEVWF